ncbi:MAG: PSD1 and planctomycete cytochrome C domain-containing protein [Verrucomicrobiota bacterium]
MKKFSKKQLLVCVGFILVAGNLGAQVAPAADAAGLEFFEKKIRPLLVDNCYKCHSQQSEKVKGGLLLDSKESVLKGGDTGPALIPGNVEKSLLVKAVRYADENLQMPPKGKKLSAEQIADLEAWIKLGAPDPRVESSKSNVQSTKSGKNHWAFQPIKNAPIPPVKNKRWTRSPVDNFILAKLEAKGIAPSPAADKQALLRRATFDLTGLPPTGAEVDQFLRDKSTNAFASAVDRLLASPRYGERWGRHWLDIARYADTKGYLAGNQERKFAYSYTYRDYVIRAFNEDLPYDKFLLQQIAADRLELGEDKSPLAGLGFLTLGRQFLGNIHDITDDRIDVVTRGTMALTVACARCHDHKFDPIPTKDYYSLYGIFASSHEPEEKPFLGFSPPEKLHAEYLAEKTKRDGAVKSFREQKSADILSTLRLRSGEFLLAAFETQQLADKSKAETLARERKLDPGVVQRWVSSLAVWSNATNPIFAPWFAFATIPASNFTAQAKVTTATLPEKTFLNPVVLDAFTNAPASIKEVSERYGKIFADTEKLWRDSIATAATNTVAVAVTSLTNAPRESLREILYSADAPPNLGNVDGIFDIPSIERLRELRRQVAELDAVHPGAPPRAMSLADNATPNNVHVFVRGNPGNQGAEVPRHFLSVLSSDNPKPFEKGSSRLELAQAIASKENPLTARVLVNRVWLHHFGKGLVSTPSDFGVRSEPPSHPELLDFLAWNFMEQGWSLKKLHRQIMLSSAYQQSSDENPVSAKVDPENKLLWHMNRQRLDFEELRDSLLAVADKLDPTAGGHSVDIVSEPFSNRRSVYGFIDRQNLPGIFRTFDFANPDTSSPQRFFTTVPQQALFLLNNGFVVDQAKGLTANTNFAKAPRDEARVDFLYEKIFQRNPDKTELKAAEQFLKTQATIASNSFTPPVWQYGFGEFVAEKKSVRFTALSFFTNQQWQASATFPDPGLGYAMLNPAGGHPGNQIEHSVIRRWTSPFQGTVKIEGTLSHPSDKGDGVLGRVVSSRAGEIGKWIAHNGKAETVVAECEVQRGDTIDFITEMQAGANTDTFQWAPTVSLVKVAYGSVPPKRNNWSAQNDFEGQVKAPKSLSAWEKYAQVLLLSNEFMFVD